MRQARVNAGKDMENSVLTNGWIKKATKPILKWRAEGRNNIDKIIKSNYDPKVFGVLENVSLNKYDIYNPTTKKQREVKSYYIKEVTKWTLYSEPYFKIATKTQLNKISADVYNDFLRRFYEYTNNNGTLKFIQEQMTQSNEGIVFKDGFVPLENIEFRTIIQSNQWKGYDRIQIQFKVNK